MKKTGMELRGTRSLLLALSQLEQGQEQVARRTLNKTAPGMKTEAVKLLRRELTIKAKEIRSRVSVIRATKTSLSAGIRAHEKKYKSGRRGAPPTMLPLSAFLTRPTRPVKRQSGKGVDVQIKQRGTSKVIEGAFLKKMKSGHVGVFTRLKKKSPRLPIRELFGIGIQPYLRRGNLRRMLMRRTRIRLQTNFRRELRYELHRTFGKMKRIAK